MIYSWVHMIMKHVVLHKNLRSGIWPECESNVTKLGKANAIPHKDICAHGRFYGNIPDYKI